jgi:hypothetical protein
MIDDALVLEIEVQPSGQAIHFMDYEPWIRDGTSTRRARASEVEHLILDHHSGRPVLEMEAHPSSLIKDPEKPSALSFCPHPRYQGWSEHNRNTGHGRTSVFFLNVQVDGDPGYR